MSPWQRTTKAVNLQQPDRVPKTAGFTPHIQRLFEEQTGAKDPAAYFGMEMRGVGFLEPKQQGDFSPYYPEGIPEGAYVTEYGTCHVPGGFYHFDRMRFPMRELTTIEELEAYPWPDFTPEYRSAHLEDDVKRVHDEGYYVIGGVGHIWENSWQLTGMEKLMLDFHDNPEFAAYILDRVTEDRCFMARRCAEAGCDQISLGDDVGMQHKLMMHPDTWRRWLKPRLAREIKAATDVNPDISVFYHSDGNIESIIEDLIEVGVTVLNPVQPECMDPVALKRHYGDRLAFWGTIGTQTTMPFGTPEDVRQWVKRMCETVGEGGGLVLAPTHVLEPDVPWHNIVAMFEAIVEYGVYRD